MPNDQWRIAVALERIADSLEQLVQHPPLDGERIAQAIDRVLERRDADDNLTGEERCKRCGLPEWDCDCDVTPVEPYECPECGHKEFETHALWCVHEGLVKVPPVSDSFPTPGAPAPERPEGVHFDVICEPEFRKGDTIIVHTPDGERREFIVGEDNPSQPVEGTPGTWSHCGNPKEHAAHVFDTGSNEGPYYNVQCLGTPRLPVQSGEVITVETREDVDIDELHAAGWSGCMHDSDCACSPERQARDTAIITATTGIGKPRSSGGPYYNVQCFGTTREWILAHADPTSPEFHQAVTEVLRPENIAGLPPVDKDT